MTPYTTEDLCRGIGAFDHAMRAQNSLPDYSAKLSAGAAIGTLSAMMRSGLSATKMEALIGSDFAFNERRLKQILAMYEGDSWDIHLWHHLPNGQYKLCTDLCRSPKPDWRYDPTTQADF